MPTTPRPLPRIPPPHLTFVQPAEVRPYRPLPTPPLWPASSSSASSVESVCLQTPPPLHATRDSSSSIFSFTSLSSASSEPLFKPRPKLRIIPTSPALRKNSLDSLTVRSPALYDPGQTLSPAVDRRPSSPKRAPHTPKRFNQVSATHSVFSSLASQGPAIITEPDIPESDEDEPVSVLHIPQPRHSTSNRALAPQPALRSQSLPKSTDRIRNRPLTATGVVADVIGDSASDDKTVGLNPRITSSTDLSNGHESRASDKKPWKPFPNISKAVMKSHLFRRKPRSTKSPVADAERVSQMASPLNQTWYKERDGWRWVERDVDEVLAELRKLR